MKVYFDIGMRDATRTIGYTESVLNSIGSCSKFKKSHLFLLRVWEANYRTFLTNFLSGNTTGESISTQIKDLIKQSEQLPDDNASSLLKLVKHICEDESKLKQEFNEYMSQLSSIDDTCKYWAKFIFEDCLPYVGLYVSLRSGNWNLRLASLKQMAALFTAYDRTMYQKLIPRHLAELLQAPPEVLSCLQKGGFAVSIYQVKYTTNLVQSCHRVDS